MINNLKLGEVLAWIAASLPVAAWLFAGTDEPAGGRGAAGGWLVDIGQLAGLVGVAMLAIAFIIASRARFLEGVFGGLDKMYQAHHRLGQAAFWVLILHPTAYALRFVPDRPERALLLFLPSHREMAVNLGVYAFWAFVLLMVLTLFVKIAYHNWKISHKFLGLVLMLATVHMFTVEATPGRSVALSSNRPLMVYMAVLTGLGIAAFLYKAFILPIVSRRNTFSVRSVDRPSDRVLEIELSPTARRVDFAPGQFVFVTFDQRGLSREAHPFTICSVPEDEGIVLTVKALGDFTEALHRRLRAGTKAWVEGPYGRFDYRSGSSAQIWLGAGVGIAPFLSWARHLERSSEQGRRATLYYCVRDRSDAVHFEEFRRIADRLRNLDVTLVCSREQGHVRAADLEPVDGKDIFMCGPRRFTTDLKSQLLRLGVPEKRIHYEDFEFR